MEFGWLMIGLGVLAFGVSEAILAFFLIKITMYAINTYNEWINSPIEQAKRLLKIEELNYESEKMKKVQRVLKIIDTAEQEYPKMIERIKKLPEEGQSKSQALKEGNDLRRAMENMGYDINNSMP